MDKNAYISQLSNHLHDLNKEEYDAAIQFVEEYFDEAGVENEQKVIDELGNPFKYAAQIKAEATIKGNKNNLPDTKPWYKQLWFIILGICSLPITVPLLFTIGVLCFVFLLLVVVFIFTLIILSISGIITSIPLIITALPSINTTNGLLEIGVSISLLGITMAICCLVYILFTKLFPYLINVFTKLFQKLKGGNKNEK